MLYIKYKLVSVIVKKPKGGNYGCMLITPLSIVHSTKKIYIHVIRCLLDVIPMSDAKISFSVPVLKHSCFWHTFSICPPL